MPYPNYPNNRLIVGGVDLTEKFKMVLSDGCTLSPPAPKTYAVDIPGGNGKLDLTETLLGDTAYSNRSQEFTFYIIDVNDFEKAKTEVSAFLHGKSFDYVMTMDPEYTYHGRFSISTYMHSMYSVGRVGCIKVKVDADPFKYKAQQVVKLPALGGNTYILKCGRKRVRPVFEVSGYTKIIFKGKKYVLYQGTWALNDILFTQGDNEIYVSNYDVHSLTWGGLLSNNTTWGQFRRKRLNEWYKSVSDINTVVRIWSDFEDHPVMWRDIGNEDWGSITFKPESVEHIKDVCIKYDWGDL